MGSNGEAVECVLTGSWGRQRGGTPRPLCKERGEVGVGGGGLREERQRLLYLTFATDLNCGDAGEADLRIGVSKVRIEPKQTFGEVAEAVGIRNLVLGGFTR